MPYPYPVRVASADDLSAEFDDHTESIHLGPWTEITIGNVRLIRRDGTIEATEVEEGVEVG